MPSNGKPQHVLGLLEEFQQTAGIDAGTRRGRKWLSSTRWPANGRFEGTADSRAADRSKCGVGTAVIESQNLIGSTQSEAADRAAPAFPYVFRTKGLATPPSP